MSTMTQTATNINYSNGCQVTFDSNDLGYFKDAVTFAAEASYKDITASNSTMIIDRKATQERARVTINMLETELNMLTLVMPLGTYVLDGGGTKKKIGFGGGQLTSSDAKQLIVTPTSDGSGTLTTDNNEKVTIFKCFPDVQINNSYSTEDGEVVVPVVFEGIKDSTQSAGQQLYLLGDSTATA